MSHSNSETPGKNDVELKANGKSSESKGKAFDMLDTEFHPHHVPVEKRGIRWRAFNFVNERFVQVGLIIMLLIDVIALVVELVLDSEYPTCLSAQRICPPPLSMDADCNDPPGAVEATHLALFCLSCVILCLFLVEISMTIFALGLKFFKNPLYIMDAIVVSASLTIEIWAYTAAQDGGNQAQAKSIADVLIFVRLWRFVRIAHGIYSVAHETIAEKVLEIKELEEDVEELKALLLKAHAGRMITASQRHVTSPRFVKRAPEPPEELVELDSAASTEDDEARHHHHHHHHHHRHHAKDS